MNDRRDFIRAAIPWCQVGEILRICSSLIAPLARKAIAGSILTEQEASQIQPASSTNRGVSILSSSDSQYIYI